MATAEYKVTAGSFSATAQPANLVGAIVADAAAADTAVGTVVTDNTTTLSAIDTFAASVIAITGDTYSAHQFTFGGATGLTHAQWATVGAQLNTAITNFLTGQTDTNTAKTATALAKTDGTNISADMSVYIGNVANIGDLNVLEQCWRRIKTIIQGSGLLSVGSGNPRVI